MALDVLLLGFTDCSIRVGDVGIQAVSGVLFFAFLLSFIDSEIHYFYFYFTRWRVAIPLLLYAPGNLRGYGRLDLSAVRSNGCSMRVYGCGGWNMN